MEKSKKASTKPTKKSPTLTLVVKKLGINGEGIAYYKNTLVFIPGALPKEKVLVRIEKQQRNFLEGKLIKILKASPKRQVPPCPIYDTCGGCQLQHLSYEGQLDFKKDLLKQALHKYKPQGYETYRLLPTLGMDEPFHYRNKAQYQVGMQNGKGIAGLYQENSHHLVELKNCLVQIPITQEIMNETMKLVNQFHFPIYQERSNQGILKTLVVRTSLDEKEVQLVFINRKKGPESLLKISQILQEKFPQLVSIMENIKPERTSLIFGEETFLISGKTAITDRIEEVTFDLSPRAFYQLNPKQTKVLYAEAKKALNLKEDDTLIDAYCGVGTIGLSMAKKAKEVRGMDIIPESIENAKANAKRLQLTNTRYEVGPAETLIPKWLKDGFKPDAMVVDPPRTGLDEKLLQTLITYPVEKLVYVSCNVSTLARDLKTLSELYQVEYLQSVDMFPQTARCEVVVKLTKKN